MRAYFSGAAYQRQAVWVDNGREKGWRGERGRIGSEFYPIKACPQCVPTYQCVCACCLCWAGRDGLHAWTEITDGGCEFVGFRGYGMGGCDKRRGTIKEM